MKRTKTAGITSCAVCAAVLSVSGPAGAERLQGLVGTAYSSSDFKRPYCGHVLRSLAPIFDYDTGFGGDWAARWEGMITAPATGATTIRATSPQKVTVTVGGLTIAAEDGSNMGTLEVEEGRSYPVEVLYSHYAVAVGRFSIEWSWAGRGFEVVPAEAISHSKEQETYFNCAARSDPAAADSRQFALARGKHVVVHKEAGKYSAWPANNGIWSWGNEILVGFTCGYQAPPSAGGHAIDQSKPSSTVLARSLDGGETWNLERPERFADDLPEAVLQEPVDFGHPDFAMRCAGSHFAISYDRGKTWQGRYRFVGSAVESTTCRTDYVVEGPRSCAVFVSTRSELVKAGEFSDRAFCIGTADGGQNWQFLAWMTGEPLDVRSVMPSTARLSDKHYVSAMRRRVSRIPDAARPPINENWIDVHQTLDAGKTWAFLSKVANTDDGTRNGNPPALLRLRDGRLVVAFGFRDKPYGIRARVSKDNGKTWSDTIRLRDDGVTWDFGYCRMVQRPDGKLVTIYYFKTSAYPEHHIAATIWDPDDLDEPERQTGTDP